MDNKPPFDRGLVIPVILGVFSVCGICLVLLLGRLSASRTVAVLEDTATPFKYLFLGTEPGILTTTPEEETLTEESTPTAVEFEFSSPTSSTEDLIVFATATRTPPGASNTSAPTPITASTAPLNPGTYDQNDQRIIYTGDWIAQTGVAGVFQNSLYVSNSLGDALALRFIGEQIRIFYQAGPGLGSIRISLDTLQFDLAQSAGNTANAEWVSPLLINGTHTVTITHVSGGAINIDSFIVPDVLKTPTPTSTP